MNVNIFEGGRRLLRASQGAIVVASIIYCFSLPSLAPYKYDIRVPNGDWTRADRACNTEFDSVDYVEREYEGKGVSFVLCYRSTDFNGKRLIPYTIDNKDMVTGDEKTSGNVRSYVSRKSKEFKIPKEDLENFPATFEEDRFWEQVGIVMASLIVVALAEVIARIIGWIVRGFINTESENGSAD